MRPVPNPSCFKDGEGGISKAGDFPGVKVDNFNLFITGVLKLLPSSSFFPLLRIRLDKGVESILYGIY